MNILEKLNSIEYHDHDIKSLKVDLANEYIELIIEETDDAPERYLFFQGLKHLRFEPLGEFEYIEIFDASFAEVENEFSATFSCLLGFGKSGWKFSFHFSEIEIK